MSMQSGNDGKERPILLVINRYAPYRGGRENQVELLAKCLSRNGCNAMVVTRLEARSRVFTWTNLPLAVALMVSPFGFIWKATQRDGYHVAYVWPGLMAEWAWMFRKVLWLLLFKRKLVGFDDVHTFHLREDLPFAPSPIRPAFRKILSWPDRAYQKLLSPIIHPSQVVHSHDMMSCFARTAMQVALDQQARLFMTPYWHGDAISSRSNAVIPYWVTQFAQPRHGAERMVALLKSDSTNLKAIGVQVPISEIGLLIEPIHPNTDSEDFRIKHRLQDGFILFVGRVVRYKGVVQILDAAQRIWEKFPKLQFVFIGPEYKYFWQQSLLRDKAEYKGRIRFMGECSDQLKVNAMSAALALCLPSAEEIFPISVVEAWKVKTPVIAGPAVHIQFLIEDANGGIFIQQDPISIADAVISMAEAPARAREMGINGSRYVSEHLEPSSIEDKCCRLYEKQQPFH